MKIQVLVTTMFAVNFSKIEALNLRNVDVIIANQTDYCKYEEMDFPERNVHAVMVSTNTRGSGTNRNILLTYATGDIILFADDDMYFVDGFEQYVINEFTKSPDADAIKFYCVSTNEERPLAFRQPESLHRAKRREMMSCGVPALAIRRSVLKKRDVLFPTSIGAGEFYGCGEDTIFYRNMYAAEMHVYVSPILLAYINQEDSTWYAGLDEHYFITSGYIYAKGYGRLALLAIIRRAYKMRNDKDNSYSFTDMVKMMKQGMKEYRKR